MKLKGLVWFLTIALTLISLWVLSYTWVVRNFENQQKTKAERFVKANAPALTGDDQKAAIDRRQQELLDSLKDTKIFPLTGATYKELKALELNLGLDLQGGINVTLDVSLDGVLRSLSNNPKDTSLNNAINAALAQKVNSDANFIVLFRNAFKAQNPTRNLAGLFAGSGRDIKPTDTDDVVVEKLRKITDDAIGLTYKTLQKRIDKFGVAQPNINLDENRGIITVELAGVKDPKRVQDYLQSSANLQFWEVYRIDDIASALQAGDEALGKILVSADTGKVIDSAKLHPIFRVMSPAQGYQDKETGKVSYPANIGFIQAKDTSIFFKYLDNEVFRSNIPADCRFMLGIEEKDDKSRQRYFQVYAIKTIFGSDKAPLEGDGGIEDASAGFSENGKPSVNMRMTNSGAATWARLTTKNVGRPIAITLDNIVYSAPNVNGPIEGGNSEITGNFTLDQTQDMANILKAGKLAAPAKIVAQQVVGPTLGKNAVDGGKMAFILSFVVIFALMLLYFNTAGWVANIALILNLLFTIGILTALGFTLTAAGIAGLVLTIGMAVDTNVIIFERIKEELTKGKGYEQAVNDGYRRSLAPVIDAHVTTLLTAVILFYFGLGPVLGFATTQIIGIILSLFCGILVSRLITDVWTKKQRHFNYFTAISKRVFKHAAFKFIEYRKVAYAISVVVLIAGVGAYFNGFNKGVEFEGGRSYVVEFPQKVKNEDIRTQLKAAFNEYPTIKTVGDERHLNITTAYKRSEANADNAVLQKLYEGLKPNLPNISFEEFAKKNIQGFTTVQPTISDDLKSGAVKATIFAILIIFIYIFFRFRDWRYSLGTIFALLHDVLVTLAVFSFFKNVVNFPLEIDQHFIAAVLTVIGFSMNDTVIVFDRVREYSKQMPNLEKGTIINRAINDTLSRTIMTSLTVFITILILFLVGGEVTKGFAFAMLIGVITGTYSSIFVAAPVLVDFAKDKPLGEADILGNDTKKATPAVKKA
jgi:SecD/SecF fusion protein